MDWRELVELFHLEGEVEEFVKKRVKEIVNDKHEFYFEGSNYTYYCDTKEPHLPHVIGTYDTVANGTLEQFCLGKEGTIEINGEKKQLIIVIERQRRGNAYTPSTAKGYYFFK